MTEQQEYLVTVRFGAMGQTSRLPGPIPDLIRGEEVIARTERGVEFASVLTKPEPCEAAVDPAPDRCCVLRRATDSDRKKLRQIDEEKLPEEMTYCEQMIKQHDLPMRLVTAEHIFGGNRIIYYFLADGRVDFRNLVKDLARQYQTRIELRQIGVRDEARLMADYEHCGRELCCRTFLDNLDPVTMRMAKNQKATLDPSKISGRCGRLMCCLRYENEVYEELRRSLPQRGATVETPRGRGVVKDREILAQKVWVEVAGHGMMLLHVDELSAEPVKRPPPRRDQRREPEPRREREERRPRRAEPGDDLAEGPATGPAEAPEAGPAEAPAEVPGEEMPAAEDAPAPEAISPPDEAKQPPAPDGRPRDRRKRRRRKHKNRGPAPDNAARPEVP
ncbi:MAG TPA: regulatory iron-sulfur-containing complex subunit RicT [Candidatus Brocadiia bacterium]|nr:regulatory iron-sulfur-containing complex subunit RicT [Candidatus Brocadiia bacterium]